MMRRLLLVATPCLALAIAACGGSKPPPAAPTTTTTTTTPPDPTKPIASAPGGTNAAPLDKHAAAEAIAHEDPAEKEGPIDLAPLVDVKAKPTFPKQTVGDHDCLKELAWSGKHKVDFATLVSKCGTPTGMIEYTKPHEGKLHIKHDRRDEFRFHVQKGMCYRYFAVADDGIKDIDIIVLKKGALLAMDKTDHPIAVIDTEKLWCVDEDMDLQFNIEVDGAGAGGYTFGVWTRPNVKK